MLFTDLGMPGVDGREVARTVKQNSPATRVLLLTGWADRLSIEGERPEGVDRILGKPISKAARSRSSRNAPPKPGDMPPRPMRHRTWRSRSFDRKPTATAEPRVA